MRRTPRPLTARHVTLFVCVGVLFFLRGRQVDSVDYMNPQTFDDWLAVFGFSAALMCLATALPVYAELAGGRTTCRTSLVAAAGLALASASNVLEDGLSWSWAFWFYVAGASLIVPGLLALTLVMAWRGRGTARLLAVVPGGTAVGLVLFERSRGVILLAVWSAAALLAARPLGTVPRARET